MFAVCQFRDARPIRQAGWKRLRDVPASARAIAQLQADETAPPNHKR
jgi:hypothetical protein